MAYTNNNGQTRVGVRIVPLSVVIPTISALLDSYSGAAAAYSLRKLKSSYTGSAIRVRRSSDNTELNIGFDSDGNLDTVALSSFVGTGNGFVSIWYDQSGSYNLIQTTAANQPSIVLSGAINTQNGKPILITDYNSYMINNSVSINGTTNSIFATIKMVTTRGNIAIMAGYGNDNQHFVSRNINGNGRYYDSGGQEITAAVLPNGLNLIGIHENSSGITVYENGANLVTNFAHSVNNTTGIVIFRRDVQDGNYMQSGSGFAELIVYGNSSKLSDNSAISNNINTYYSVYPNPTSVWNLLNAVYSADTTASSSLKTSLVASYNGESNANDSFGSNNGTAVGGLTYGTGKIGNAFQFNGTNAYVSLPNNSWNFTGNFSISMWVKFSSSSLSQILISNFTIGGATTVSGWFIEKTDNAELRFRGYNNGSLVLNATKIAFSPSTSVYTHLVVSRSATNSKIYINGVLDITSTVTAAPNYESTNYPMIGANRYNSTTYQEFFNGNIDGVNIWQKELTQSEITELYNSGNGAQYITDNFYKPTPNDALNTYNGTAQGGLTYGLGKVGTAFQFNGTNAHVSFPAGSFNSLTTDFSVSAWVYLPSGYNNQNNCPIFSNMSAPGWFETPGGFWLRFAGTTIQLAIGGKINPSFLGYDINSDNLLGTWIHVVAVRKNNTSNKIYINNVLKASYTDTNPATLVNPVYYTGVNLTTPTIGNVKMPNGVQDGYYAYNGSKIDAVGIWNKELTATEVTELYNSGNGKQYPN